MMSSSADQTRSILLFGATGYVGGATLHVLLALAKHSDKRPHIVAPVSSRIGADKVANWARDFVPDLDVQIVADQGADLPKIRPYSLDIVVIPRSPAQSWYEAAERLAAHTDCAVQLATSDDLELTKAIDRGLAQAKEHNGRRGTIVHASGVQLIESAPVGKEVETPTYDDTDLAQLKSISDDAAHRLIDLAIIDDIASAKIGGGAIVCPALIYGISDGPVRRISQQIPGMVEKALLPLNRQAVYCGEGTNVWNAVHIDELSDLINKLIERWAYDGLPSSPPEAHSTFYFAGTKELFRFKDVAAAIGEVLAKEKVGKFTDNRDFLVSTSEPKSVPVPKYDGSQKGVRVEDGDRAANADEDEQRAPSWPCRTNSRCISKRAEQEFGWVAERVLDHDSLVLEIQAYLRFWRNDGTLLDKTQAA
ncbi:hypothetical protein OC844_002345 [Tilletia horrida]|nr:hypothetical protein OC844_002345 [Tilletia horrida]